MDKQTLSGYGWIVIVTLVLAVLLALATPFGTYVGDGIVTTVNGLINTSSKAVDEDQINTMSDKWENKFSTFDKAGSVNGGSSSDEEETLAPGLYDENGVMTMSWQELLDAGVIYILDNQTYSDTNIGASITRETINGKIVISDDIAGIGGDTFLACDKLTSVIIPDNITSIGNGAFAYCSNLTSINIPKGVTYLEISVFQECSSLTSVNYNGTKTEWENIFKETSWNNGCPEITVHCTDGNIVISAN